MNIEILKEEYSRDLLTGLQESVVLSSQVVKQCEVSPSQSLLHLPAVLLQTREQVPAKTITDTMRKRTKRNVIAYSEKFPCWPTLKNPPLSICSHY